MPETHRQEGNAVVIFTLFILTIHFRNGLLNVSFLLQVVEHGMFVKHCKVEVYLLELNLCENDNMDNVVTRHFSKADTIGKAPHCSMYLTWPRK